MVIWRQTKHGAAKRADTKAHGRMDDDGDSEKGAIRGRGDGTDDAPTGEGAGVTFDEEGEEQSTDADEDAQAAKPQRRRRDASPEPAAGRLGSEQTWSDRKL